MSREFLTQEEVDALLRGVEGETETPAAPPEAGVRSYDFAKQERIVRGRMPTLEMINERFARQLRIGLFNFMRRSCEISVGPVRVIKYSEFVRNLVVPTNLNLVRAEPLRGTALFVFEPQLVFMVIDGLFGGEGRFHTRIEGREFTPTEQRVIQRLLEVVFDGYGRSWAPVQSLRFEHLRSEMNTQFANIAMPNEIVVVTSFTIELGSESSSAMHICMPYSMLEPLRTTLASPLHGEHDGGDRRWVRLLSKQVQSAQVELVAALARLSVPLRRVLELRPGDVIPIELPQTVTAEVDGVAVMECRYGVFRGQYALRVERMIDHGAQERENLGAARAIAST